MDPFLSIQKRISPKDSQRFFSPSVFAFGKSTSLYTREPLGWQKFAARIDDFAPQASGAERWFENKQAQPQLPADLVSQDAVLRNTGLRAPASVRTTGVTQPPSLRPSSPARRVQVDRRSPGRLGVIPKRGNRNPLFGCSFALLFCQHRKVA